MTEADRVLAALDEEAAAVAAGDMRRYTAVLAADCVFLPPNLAPKSDAELRSWLGDFLARVQVEWLSYTHVECVLAGELAYHVFAYRWRVTPRAGGEASVSQGKGLHILRRHSDGSWKILREIWNVSPES